METDEISDSLVANALDFLNRAIVEFDESPKYSVIHFCAAVEMFLKARLMHEDWTLIVAKPERTTEEKFMSGDFLSISLEECRVRLRDKGVLIDDDAYGSFVSLSRHRNKMVHFFHPDVDDDGAARTTIVAEQSRSWFHLHKLLRRWRGNFQSHRNEIAAADYAMKKHREYLKTKFATLRPALATHRTGGRIPMRCRACEYAASIPDEVSQYVKTSSCMVCDNREVQVQIECPSCEKSITLFREGYSSCPECDEKIEPDQVVEFFVDPADAYNAMRNGESHEPANCGTCEGYHTVVEAGDGVYLCASCFDISDHVEQCEWCNEDNTGDMEDSYALGCCMCDGYAGHTKDD